MAEEEQWNPAAEQQGGQRYMWAPILHSKIHRTSLLDNLAPALAFISFHLRHGRTVSSSSLAVSKAVPHSLTVGGTAEVP
jgi:hypothetical protein